MLVGREVEAERIGGLLSGARRGTSGVLVVRGDPGIGKSALLQYAEDSALGMAVLKARGIESEAEIAFSGLFELLRPALALIDRIPSQQAQALGGALRLSAAVNRDRFIIGAATLSLLAAYAEEAPLIVLIDDAHWIDASSSDALTFAVRRLLAEPILVVVAVRTGEESAFDAAGLPQLELGGLDADAAKALLTEQAGSTIRPEVIDWLYRSTAGNPLALVELAANAPHLGVEPFDRPLTVETRVERAFARRVQQLSAAARQSLVIAAAAGSGDLGPLTRALDSAGLEPAVLEEAESVGIIRIGEQTLEFRHPLMRAAIYHSATPAERRAAHRLLAEQLDADRFSDVRAWHLASAALGPSEEVAEALESSGNRARERSAYAVAASAFERAAQLTSADSRRAERLLAAADSAWLAGAVERASDSLEAAREIAQTPRLQAEIDQLSARVSMRHDPVTISHDTLVRAADRIAHIDPARACRFLAEAADSLMFAAAASRMLETARRAWELASGLENDEVRFFTCMALGQALIVNGRGGEGADLIRRSLSIMQASDALQLDPRLVSWAGRARLFLRDNSSGSELIHRAVDLAREQGAVGMLAVALNQLALDSATSDRWVEAGAQFAEAIRLARETGQFNDLCSDLAALSRLEARQGRADQCRAHAAEAQALAQRLGLGMFSVWASLALANLELVLGDAKATIQHGEEANRVIHELQFNDPDVSPAPEMTEAYLRLGRLTDARQAAERCMHAAVEKGQPWALARADRCLGLISGDDAYAQYFANAMQQHSLTADSFERGRTHLCFGERLRRERRRAQAREQLRLAFDIFDRLGAEAWTERTRLELLATGEAAPRRRRTPLDQLTPQEFQIAQLLADGATTREAAAKLFLSPKTIEYHLRNVYDKLDVHTRAELKSSLVEHV
jgi:DNA-binding CsgD family transcriptional regulator